MMPQTWRLTCVWIALMRSPGTVAIFGRSAALGSSLFQAGDGTQVKDRVPRNVLAFAAPLKHPADPPDILVDGRPGRPAQDHLVADVDQLGGPEFTRQRIAEQSDREAGARG